MGVMSTKIGTKAFGQTVEKPTSTNSGMTSIAPGDRDKVGGEDMGALLNKVADPNYVEPTRKAKGVGNPNLDKDAFFKLMIAQMKNQDPTSPLKPHEMSAQLATFSGLEQMQNMNATLTEMKNGNKPAEQFQALSMIGKAVSGDSAKLVRSKGDKDSDFRFTLPKAASSAQIKVRNSEGEVVRTYDLKGLKEGANKVSWNGKDDKGNPVRPDEYNFSIEAKDGGDQKMAVKTAFDGVITGVNYTPEGTVLMIGNQTVRLSDVKKIIDPSLLSKDQNAKDVTAQDLKKDGAELQTEKGTTGAQSKGALTQVKPEAGKQAEAAMDDAKKPSILDQVGLSREMMTKLQKTLGTGG